MHDDKQDRMWGYICTNVHRAYNGTGKQQRVNMRRIQQLPIEAWKGSFEEHSDRIADTHSHPNLDLAIWSPPSLIFVCVSTCPSVCPVVCLSPFVLVVLVHLWGSVSPWSTNYTMEYNREPLQTRAHTGPVKAKHFGGPNCSQLPASQCFSQSCFTD